MKRALILALTGTMLPFAAPALADSTTPNPSVAQVAPPAPAYPKASVSGLLFADDRVPTGLVPNVAGQPRPLQSFNVTRAFLTGTAAVNDVWSGTITVNPYAETYVSKVGATTTSTEAHNVDLQYAYVQAKGLFAGNITQFGLIDTPMSIYEIDTWGYRMLGNLPTQGGIGSSSNLGGGASIVPLWDKGIRTKGSAANGLFSYDAAIFNGEGFRSNEIDGQKTYQLRLTLSAISGLDISAVGSKGNPGNAQVADRAMALIKYQQGDFRIGVSGIRTWDQASGAGGVTNGDILSAFTVIPLPIGFLPSPALVLRADQYNPDTDSATPVNDQRLETIAGLSIKPAPGVTCVLDDQNVDRYNSATNHVNYNVVALNTSFAF